MSRFAELGDLAKDEVTGYEGIVVCKSQHLTGCDRVTLQSKAGSDGKLPDCYSFDITTVTVLERQKVKPIQTPPQAQPKPTVKAGGPPTKALTRRY